MTWRTVILTRESKVSLRLNHLIVTSEEVSKIPLSEIGVVIIENPNIMLSGHILNALSENKIMTLLCDQQHNPAAFLLPVYGHHRQSKILKSQFGWLDEQKGALWQKIIKEKIMNQARLLDYFNKNGYDELSFFSKQVENHDSTNREGHAAKVYFNRLFGNQFYRGYEDVQNWGLNYGYSILHSLFARHIVSKGHLTEIGIHHTNEFNQYNLASDLMEVFRPIVDFIVATNISECFGKEERRSITNMLQYKIFIRNGEQFLSQCIQIYLEGCLHYLNTGEENRLFFPAIEFDRIYKTR